MHEPVIVLLILAGTLLLFIRGYWRHDVVAALSLIVSVMVGIVPVPEAFSGFSNPAVITVASVMIMTQALRNTGIVDFAVRKLTFATSSTIIHIGVLTTITALLSAFMNNVGALALMMPIAIQSAIQSKRSPSLVLLPISFGSLLGGLTTAIGTPPNILIATFRQQLTGHPFVMFDFTPVGFTVAAVCILFISLVGWRLIPQRKAAKQTEDMFQIQDYTSEIKVPENSPVVEKTIRELEGLISGDFAIIGLIRNKRKRLVIRPTEILQANDILIIQADHKDLQKLIHAGKLEIVGGEKITREILSSEDTVLAEAVIPQGSRMEGRSARSMRLRSRHRINIIAISREGSPFKQRLHQTNLRAGDVVLLQGEADTIQETAVGLGFLPLVERGVQLALGWQAIMPFIIFILAVVSAATQVLSLPIAFASAALAMVILNIMSIRSVYESVDWSVIVLIGAMIPVGGALQTAGGTDLIAQGVLALGHLSPVFILGALFLITMLLTDVLNNAATAVIMAPIALSLAHALNANIDPFLMTVAVGASCSFLTPIGHQNNTLVLGPGGYKFLDYLRMGVFIDLLVLAVGIPMILWIWPL